MIKHNYFFSRRRQVKKILSLLIVISMMLCAAAGLSSCSPQSAEPSEPKQLETPSLTLIDDTAIWNKVVGAIGYELRLDSATITYDETITSRKLTDGQTLTVRALGDGKNYLTSEWSAPTTYTATPAAPDQTDPKPKLATPVVTLNGPVASWESIEGADGYELSVGTTLIEVDASVTFYVLSDGDVLIVRAISSDADTKASGWSTLVKYTAPTADPENPDVPDNPGDPGEPNEPENPAEPDTPAEPENPNEPDTPADPENPDEPDTPAEPENPDEPGTPVDPGTPGEPETPVEPENPTCTAHTDSNNDGACDSCYASVIVIIDIYAINDLHGKFCDSDDQPGVDELTSYFKDRENVDDNVIILSSGDMWQGSAESVLTYGQLMTEWMNIIGVVSMTLGNHEYDWGEDYIRQNLEIADFPFLAINIYDKSTGKRADYCTPSIMIEEGGLQIGIIGAIGDCYSSILADMVSGVEFKTGSAMAALVEAEADRLRALGADLIVLSMHDSTDGYYNSLSASSVDIVFEGHSHQAYVTTDSYGVYHIQGGGENYGISHAEIAINSVTGSLNITEANVIGNSVYSKYEDDEEVLALMDKYQDIIDIATTPLGKVSVGMSDSQLEDLVAQLYYEAGVEKWGDKYDIVLGGGFLKTRDPYDLAAGIATYGDLLSLLPFNNQLVLCKISGRNLLNKFINTSNSDYHVYTKINTSSISSSGTYYVVVDTYTSAYSSNGLTVVEYYDDTTFARDLVAEYIKEGNLDISNTGYNLTSIADVLAIGNSLALGETTSEVYYIKGTITEIKNTTYGNLYLTDENGNTVYVYGLYDGNGNRYDKMTKQPKAGDEIVICSKIQNYNNYGSSLIELKNSTIIEQ